MIGYLSQSGPLHPKHGGRGSSCSDDALFSLSLLPPLHPLLAFIIHYSIAITTIFYVHDVYFFVANNEAADEDNGGGDVADTSTTIRNRQTIISNFLFIYTSILFTTRYLSSYAAGSIRHHSVLYELTWLCNSTLVMGCLSFGFGSISSNENEDHEEECCCWYEWFIQPRPMVATSCCIAVSIDQILWYIDLLGYIVTRGAAFPVGVMRYLTWEQTLWIDRFTCTHHLWTIPLILVGTAHDVELEWGTTFGLSVYIVVIQVLLSRWLTPHCIIIMIQKKNDINGIGNGKENLNHDDGNNDNGKHNKKNQEKDPRYYRYLNVNLSHELWRDISFPFLQISRDNPPCWKYLFRLLWRWQLFNGIVFVAILRPLSKLLLMMY